MSLLGGRACLADHEGPTRCGLGVGFLSTHLSVGAIEGAYRSDTLDALREAVSVRRL